MAFFLKNVSFHGILVDSLFNDKDSSIRRKQEVVDLVNQGIADGTVKPLNTILFNFDQAEQAFRYMASGRHIGKVVMKVKKMFAYIYLILLSVWVNLAINLWPTSMMQFSISLAPKFIFNDGSIFSIVKAVFHQHNHAKLKTMCDLK